MWAIFPDGTDCYTPGNVPYMVNYRVDDLDAVLSALREEGVWVDDRIQEEECGRFGWAMDADCRRIELWQLCGE